VICLISCLKLNSIENLKQRIRHEIKQITPEVFIYFDIYNCFLQVFLDKSTARLKLRTMAVVCLLNTIEIYVIKFPVETRVMRFCFIHFCEVNVQYLQYLVINVLGKLVSKASFLHL
jgi:hypothetical protein